MANHKSAVKAHKKSEEKRLKNASILSRVKTFIKKVEELVGLGKTTEAAKAMSKAESEIMKSVSKGTLKKNTAARKVSHLAKKVKKASGEKVATKVESKAKKVAKKVTKKAENVKKAAEAKPSVKKKAATVKKAVKKSVTTKKAPAKKAK